MSESVALARIHIQQMFDDLLIVWVGVVLGLEVAGSSRSRECDSCVQEPESVEGEFNASLDS